MKIKSYSGNREIINSGTAILFDENAELRMDIDTEKDFEFTLILKFIDLDDDNILIKRNSTEKSMTLECINFKSSLGTGTVVPFEIGTVAGKNLQLHLFVSKLTSGPREISYTFFIEM